MFPFRKFCSVINLYFKCLTRRVCLEFLFDKNKFFESVCDSTFLVDSLKYFVTFCNNNFFLEIFPRFSKKGYPKKNLPYCVPSNERSEDS